MTFRVLKPLVGVLVFSSFFMMAENPAIAQQPASAPAAVSDKSSSGLAIEPGQDFPGVIFNATKEQKAAMDIDPSLYADFWKKWHLVSVRWRQDTHEFRITYANDIAWKAMADHVMEYPQGAMFGKLTYPAEEDLALPVSVLAANRLDRLMVMVRDAKHKKVAPDGWVYVRFINPDPRAPQDKNSTGIWGLMAQKEVDSCVECHARVADRGYVFSMPFFMMHDSVKVNDESRKVFVNRFAENMHEMSAKATPRIAQNLIASIAEWKDRKLMGYEGDFFIGALGQLVPVLARMARENTDSIYMVYDRNDPDTIEIASSVKKEGYKDCVGLVRLRGTSMGFLDDMPDLPKDLNQLNKTKSGREKTSETIRANTSGVKETDLTQQFKPAAILQILCGEDPVSRQLLPLLFMSKDTDGKPSYTFAPAILK